MKREKRKSITSAKSQKAAPRATQKIIKAAAHKAARSSSSARTRETIQNWLQLAILRGEKCERKEAYVAYEMALKISKRAGEFRGAMEALSGLLRFAREALDEAGLLKWERELDSLMALCPKDIPATAWLCKAAVARHRKQLRQAQRYCHRYIRAVRADPRNASFAIPATAEEAEAKGWVMMASIFAIRGRLRLAAFLSQEILRRWEIKKFRGVNGIVYMQMGDLYERQKQYDLSLVWYQKAHAAFLSEHHWYYHLYVLFGYARLARHQQQYSQAAWFLDLVDKATPGDEFGFLRREIASERARLEQDAVDLLIDGRQAMIKTKQGGEISLGKQYVLLHILEALFTAHNRAGDDIDRGLSKAEIIQNVWNENYRPEAHDNKLYYNINRLRKLIEPDIRKPRYLLNWKEGYRLAPGLRIQFIGGRTMGKGDAH